MTLPPFMGVKAALVRVGVRSVLGRRSLRWVVSRRSQGVDCVGDFAAAKGGRSDGSIAGLPALAKAMDIPRVQSWRVPCLFMFF